MMTRLTRSVFPAQSAQRSWRPFLRAASALGFAAVSAFAARAQTPSDPAHVQAILSSNCYSCHTAKMKGGLRVDSVGAMLKGGESGAAIVPGDPDASLLAKAIGYKDADLQMPPKGKMPDADIAAIDAWIKAGAPELPSTPIAQPVSASGVSASPSVASAQEQFFENQVRPLLASKCYSCHAVRAAGGLRVDSRKALLTGGKDGPVIDLDHPEDSLLLTAVHYTDQKLQMPPKGPLDDTQVAILTQWIKDGMIWPDSANPVMTAVVTDKQRQFWSYQKPVAPAIPTTDSKWAYNDIDRFVLDSMQKQGLTPVADADRRTLLRRVTYDLTGLPPTPAEINAFLTDKSPTAYARVVDRLLASKAYGERWGRIWLDVVRYSDTTGEGADFPVPELYKYRDYVVASFNQDKPYDRFIKEQIAGDLLPSTSEPEHWNNVVATGYLANANRYEDFVADSVDNIGYAYLGTSIACARCHDHKFDPIPTADYYGIYGIFASTQYASSGMEDTRYETNMVYRDPNVLKSPQYVAFQAQLKPVADSIHAVHELPYFDDILPALEARRMALFENAPHFESAYAVTEGKPHDEYIQHLGDKKNLGDMVPRHFLQVLGNWQMPPTKGSGRLEFANWIASPENPLTARVMVNRLWQGHFGRGIVATPNDFGSRGSGPSNQPLLDYLATTFVARGWSVKAMQREMVLSHTYQLSAAESDADSKIDPDNIALWRHTRTRMDAEEIRDAMLATSGLLDTTPAGAQPFPDEAKWNYSGHTPFHAVYETDRRTLYVMTQRSRRHPYLGLFDGADATMSVGTRDHSVTPLQSLYFMNGEFPKQCAARLTGQLEGAHLAPTEEINRAFILIYGRPATREEIGHAQAFIDSVTGIYEEHGLPSTTPDSPASPLHQVSMATGAFPKPSSMPLSEADAHREAFSNFVQALYASNEFMFLD